MNSQLQKIRKFMISDVEKIDGRFIQWSTLIKKEEKEIDGKRDQRNDRKLEWYTNKKYQFPNRIVLNIWY